MTRSTNIRAATTIVGVLFSSAVLVAGETEPQKVGKALESHKLTLANAILTAQAASKGKAVEARAWLKGNELMVTVRCSANEKCMEVPIDVKTGKAGKAVAAVDAKAHGATHELVKLMDTNKIELVKAIETAQASTKGIAVMARTRAEKQGALAFDVQCVAADKAYDVIVDGKTGKVTKTRELVGNAGEHHAAPTHHDGTKKDAPKKP